MAIALIALGSNVGDAAAHLRTALELMTRQMKVLRISAVYETEPMYVREQPKFLNAAISAETGQGPLQLLATLKEIERQVGRQSRERYGPREVDLDLLAYGSLSYVFATETQAMLTVPHPKIPERRFVLAPLNDVAPDFVLPGLGRVGELLEATNAQAEAVQRREDVSLSLYGVR